MSYYGEIISVIDYIEDNLDQNIALENMAEHSNYSKYHLHRFFKAKTGHSLGEYIRQRKLAVSVDYLTNTQYSIEYISAQLAFKHPSNFTRVFKNHYKMTPQNFRVSCPEVPLTPKIQKNALTDFQDAVFFNYETIYLPAFYLTGVKHKLLFEENMKQLTANKAGRQFVSQYKDKIAHVIEPDIYYGLSLETKIDSSIYMPSFRVSQKIPLEDSLLSTVTIPNHTYAVFKYIGAHRAEEITYHTLSKLLGCIGEWMHKGNYQQADNFFFEKIDGTKSTRNYCEAHIYIPIKV